MCANATIPEEWGTRAPFGHYSAVRRHMLEYGAESWCGVPMKKLQVFAALSIIGLALSSLPASAFENYVATGHAYAPGHERLPPLNSEQDQINLQTDIYESELYTKQRERKI